MKGFLCIVTIISCSFFIGHYISIWLKWKTYVSRSTAAGFISLTAVFEVLFLFSVLFHLKFGTLALMFEIMLGISFLVCLVHFIRTRQYRRYKIRKLYISSCMMYMLIGFQIFCTSYYQHTDIDDGYFVAIANIAVEDNEIYLDGDGVYNGKDYATGNSFRPETASWELFTAFWCRLFHIHPAVMMHTIFPILLIALCYMAVYDFGLRVIKNRNKRNFFVSIYAVINLFSAYSAYASGCFLLHRIWQGKAVLVNFAFPVLMCGCYEIYKNRESIRIWIWNTMVVLGGVSLTVVGIYLMPVLYLCAGLPYIIKCIYEGRLPRALQLIKAAFISMTPVILILLYAFIMVLESGGGMEYINAKAPEWLSVFQSIQGTGAFVVLYLISVLYLLMKRKTDTCSFMLCGIMAVNLLTFFNPFFCSFVAQKITGVDVYWRLWWIFPLGITTAYVLTEIIYQQGRIKRCAGFGICFVICMLSGKYVYDSEFFSEPENAYKISKEAVLVAEKLKEEKERTVCLFPSELSPIIRQYTSKISVVRARGLSVDPQFQWLYPSIVDEGNAEPEEIKKQLKEWKVEYIYSKNPINQGDVVEVEKIDGYGYLYEVGQ